MSFAVKRYPMIKSPEVKSVLLFFCSKVWSVELIDELCDEAEE